jgi:hypothetical protein
VGREPNGPEQKGLTVTDLLDRVIAEIDGRLRDLRGAFDEHERLTDARAALATNGRPAKAIAKTETPATKAARAQRSARPARQGSTPKRAPRGENRRKILGVISDRPGVSAAEIASVTGVKKTVTYSTLTKLVADGLAEKVEIGSVAGYRVPRPGEEE